MVLAKAKLGLYSHNDIATLQATSAKLLNKRRPSYAWASAMKRRTPSSRAWCKVCRVWLADNKIQRQQHEQASKHREALNTLLADIARRNGRKRTGGLTAGGSDATAEAKSQLLDSVASSGAAARCQVGLASKRADSWEDSNSSQRDNASGDLLLDANGFPLPAGAVYGQWTKAEGSFSHSGEAAESAPSRKNDGTPSEPFTAKVEGRSQQPPQDEIKTPPAVADSSAQPTRTEIENSFKRRTAPRSRRVRPRQRLR